MHDAEESCRRIRIAHGRPANIRIPAVQICIASYYTNFALTTIVTDYNNAGLSYEAMSCAIGLPACEPARSANLHESFEYQGAMRNGQTVFEFSNSRWRLINFRDNFNPLGEHKRSEHFTLHSFQSQDSSFESSTV